MLTLTKPALQYAADMCGNYPFYCFGIVVKDTDDLAKCYYDLLDYVDMTQYCGNTFTQGKFNVKVYFRNGSFVELLCCEDSARGRRWHDVVIADDVPKKLRGAVLRKYVVWSYKFDDQVNQSE